MPRVTITDITREIKTARSLADEKEDDMLAAFARLQLDVLATHKGDWDSNSIRELENRIDIFKASCVELRHAKDNVIVIMAKGADRFDTAVPSPAELSANQEHVSPDNISDDGEILA